jgi:hypothetical protein
VSVYLQAVQVPWLVPVAKDPDHCFPMLLLAELKEKGRGNCVKARDWIIELLIS